MAGHSMLENVTIVTPTLRQGGTQRVVANLANHWATHGASVTVITTFQGEQAFEIDPRVRLELATNRHPRWRVGLPWRLLRALSRLRRLLKTTSGPIVSLGLSANVLAVLAATGTGRRVVISERNDPTRQPVTWIERIGRHLFYSRADLVTANGQHALAFMSDFVAADKLRLVPNPVALPPVSDASRLERVLLAVGRLHPQKGYDILLRAFAQTEARETGWILRIVGDGDQRSELEALTARLSIDRSVQWVGSVSNPSSEYAEATLFVQPSRYEGVSNALLEALAHGLPTIVTEAAIEGVPSLGHGEHVLTVPTEEVQALSMAVDQLTADEELRLGLGSSGRRWVVEAVADAFEDWERALTGD